MTERANSQRRAGAVVLLHDRKGRLALQQRDDHLNRSGDPVWTLFGGWLTPGEDAVAGILREIREELGSVLSSDRLVVLGVDRDCHPDGDVDTHVFGYEVKDELNRASLSEGQAWAFTPRAELAALPIWPPHRRLLEDHWIDRRD